MRLLTTLLTVLALSLPAQATDELTVKASKYSVKETVDRLTAALKDKGITPVAPAPSIMNASTATIALPMSNIV